MNCDKANTLFIDALYGELDDVSRTALRKHCEECVACGPALDGLRGTQSLLQGQLRTAAPDTLEEQIMARASALPEFPGRAQRPRVANLVSKLGRWAMHPQTAMAAVFLLMFASSALLLKGRNKSAASAGVVVSEHGSPMAQAAASAAADEEDDGRETRRARSIGAAEPAPPAAAAASARYAPAGPVAQAQGLSPYEGESSVDLRVNDKATSKSAFGDGKGRADGLGVGGGVVAPSPPDSPMDSAQKKYKAKNYDEALAEFDALARGGDTDSALWAARAVRDKHGCASALTRYDQLASSAFGTPAGYEATLEGGQCYRRQGFLEAASSRFQRLLTVPSHASRAQIEIDEVHRVAEARAREAKERALAAAEAQGSAPGGAAARAASPKPAAAKAPPATEAAKPATPQPVATAATSR
jgi:hypothetical protein